MDCTPNIAGRLQLFRKTDEGAAILEMALASSLLFAMLFGIIAMGLALYTYDYVSDAAREGARFAIVRGANCTSIASTSFCSPTSGNTYGADQADIQAYVQGLGYPGINPNNLTVNASWYTVNETDGTTATTITTCAAAGTSPSPASGPCNVPTKNSVQVQVVYSFPLNIPFWSSTTVQMVSTSQLAISQ